MISILQIEEFNSVNLFCHQILMHIKDRPYYDLNLLGIGNKGVRYLKRVKVFSIFLFYIFKSKLKNTFQFS